MLAASLVGGGRVAQLSQDMPRLFGLHSGGICPWAKPDVKYTCAGFVPCVWRNSSKVCFVCMVCGGLVCRLDRLGAVFVGLWQCLGCLPQ